MPPIGCHVQPQPPSAAVLSRSFAQQPPFEPQRPPQLRTTSGRPPLCGSRCHGLVFRRFASRSSALLTLSHVRPFGTRPHLLWPLLTADDPSRRLATSVALRQIASPPWVLHTYLHAYVRRIYYTAFRTSIGLCS